MKTYASSMASKLSSFCSSIASALTGIRILLTLAKREHSNSLEVYSPKIKSDALEVIINKEKLNQESIRGTYAIGVDLSSTTDLTCATFLIKKDKDPRVYVLQQDFIPEEEAPFADGSVSGNIYETYDHEMVRLNNGDWVKIMDADMFFTAQDAGLGTGDITVIVRGIGGSRIFLKNKHKGLLSITRSEIKHIRKLTPAEIELGCKVIDVSATKFVELIFNEPEVYAVTPDAIMFKDINDQTIRYVHQTGAVETWSSLANQWIHIATHIRKSADYHEV